MKSECCPRAVSDGRQGKGVVNVLMRCPLGDAVVTQDRRAHQTRHTYTVVVVAASGNSRKGNEVALKAVPYMDLFK